MVGSRPKGSSLVEDSRGADPKLEAKIMDAVRKKKQLVNVDLRVGELIRKGKVSSQLICSRFNPPVCESISHSMVSHCLRVCCMSGP